MALTPNFTSIQSLSSPLVITLTDTSSGSDSSVSKARVYFIKSDGTYLKQDGQTRNYIELTCNGSGIFPTTEISILDRDYALNVKVDWVNSGGSVLYTKTIAYAYTAYSETFDYGLVTSMASQPNLVDDQTFLSNKRKVRLLIDSANQAIDYGSDLTAAQFCLDDLYNIISNQSFYFPN
jgi:hypothetical protein